MDWQEVCADPNLQDLPYKIELNQWGQIFMRPVKVYHSVLQWEIQLRIYDLLGRGRVVPECAIRTRRGTKVADVAWMSDPVFEKVRDGTECSLAPEICVEGCRRKTDRSPPGQGTSPPCPCDHNHCGQVRHAIFSKYRMSSADNPIRINTAGY